MTRKNIQVFAVGWFAAACCIAGAYFILQPGPNEAESSSQAGEPTEAPNPAALSAEQHISFLESDGYVVLTQDEYNAVQEEDTPPEDGQTDELTAILHIEQGMTSGDVASLLQQLEMIEEESLFAQKLQESGRASSIKPGQYKLNNTMSIQDIIQRITS
ncbi:endolytic transglycosylase MltG [Salibacterium halotolerans]|uniref:YceG-like family protein n=1 Tax=Salibacterium halotolerans TaxID=1884432 RepID=A0A1I5NKW1_9BACI|nr:endolytic transglycosylase MltG [Salibacterium halotolerans]SFP21966.1 YceG-like family protein [Salibacterium halotolerans]